MRFIVVGAGSVGSLFGAHLAAAGERVTLVARREHCAAVGASELPWLNGEIVRLAERAGQAAPANALLLRVGLAMAERRERPGRHSLAALLTMMGDAARPAVAGAAQR